MVSPAPIKSFKKTVEAYWQAFTPWDKIALCQIKVEDGERVLEVMEEAWDGEKLFYECIPLPIIDKHGPPLTEKEVWKKSDTYCSNMTAEEFLQWVVTQLQRKNAQRAYRALLCMYWRLRRPDESFSPEYIEGEITEM